MEKFSYGLEFYHKNIFSLKEKDEFKNAIEQAKRIEKYFFNIIPNIEFIRPYIVFSYRFKKDLSDKDRILYIRGLVYASDYIDFKDLNNLPGEFSFFEENGDIETTTSKNSIWNYTAYMNSLNTDSSINELITGYDCISEDVEVESSVEENEIDAKDNNVELPSEVFNMLEECIKKENSNDTDENNNDFDNFITIEDKLDIFLNKINDYMTYTISEKVGNNYIKEEDINMVIEGMSDWFKIIFVSIKDLIDIRNANINYQNENIYKFL